MAMKLTATKILEFMSLGVPVVVADTKIDKYYFADSVVKFFHSGNEGDLAKSIVQLFKNQDLRNSLIKNAGIYAEQNSWDVKKQIYLNLVASLASSNKNHDFSDKIYKIFPYSGSCSLW